MLVCFWWINFLQKVSCKFFHVMFTKNFSITVLLILELEVQRRCINSPLIKRQKSQQQKAKFSCEVLISCHHRIIFYHHRIIFLLNLLFQLVPPSFWLPSSLSSSFCHHLRVGPPPPVDLGAHCCLLHTDQPVSALHCVRTSNTKLTTPHRYLDSWQNANLFKSHFYLCFKVGVFLLLLCFLITKNKTCFYKTNAVWTLIIGNR